MQTIEFRQLASTAQKKFRDRIHHHWVLVMVLDPFLEAVFLGYREI